MDRRRFLKLGAAGMGYSAARPPQFEIHADKRVAPAKSVSSPLDNLHITIPELPANHFLGLVGAPAPTEADYIETILRLHGDAVSLYRGSHWSSAYSGALRTGIPAATGASIRIDTGDASEVSFVEDLVSERGWRRPDGTPVEDPEALFARTIDDEPFTSFNRSVPSLFSPAPIPIATTRARANFDSGFAAVGFDNIRSHRERGLDFSAWARASFRDRLTALSDDRLDELGIDNPDSFDIETYLADRNLLPSSSEHPATDAVFREYLLHHHRRVKDYHAELKEWLQDAYPERAPPLYINQPFGDDSLAQVAVAQTYASEHVDLISVEDFRTMPAEGFGRSPRDRDDVPETDIRDYVLKLAHATGRYDTPVRHGEGLGGQYYTDLAEGDRHPMLLRVQAAEAYAMGCRHKFNIWNGPLMWRDQDWTIPETLEEFLDFLWAHQRLLTDTEPDNTVGLVWSVPTVLWNTIPQWGIDATIHTHSFTGAATLLRESQLPYGVVVFGYPSLWPDTDLGQRLAGYDAIVLPAVESLTSEQAAALEDYRSQGGVVVSSGDPPTRTASFEPTSFDVFERDGVTVLASNPGKRRLDESEPDPSLGDALNQRGVASSTVRTDGTIGVNRLTQPSESRRILHLLNYDYDPETDEFRRKTDIELQVSGLDDRFEVARYYSPRRITDLAIQERDGRHELTIPELVEWGFIVIAPSEGHLADSGSEREASERIAEAKTRIREGRDEARQWSREYTQAEIKHQSAETAFEYEAYSLAIKEAKAAVELVNEAPGTPVIAIDQVHGQRESQDSDGGANPIERLRQVIPDIEYRRLTEWNETTLSDVDVLLIPSVLASQGTQYGFTGKEIEWIESFVANGGSLAVVGRAGVADDIHELIAQFDLGFHGAPIVSPIEAGAGCLRVSADRRGILRS